MQMSKDCEHCGKSFEVQRSSAQFCSSTCRVAAHRHKAHVEQRLNSLTASVQHNLDIVKGVRVVPAWERRDTRSALLALTKKLLKELEVYDRNLKRITTD